MWPLQQHPLQQSVSARSSAASVDAQPRPLRLDEVPAEVLQACALQLVKHYAQLGWTQTFTLQTVCRRFREALKAPFWTTLHPDVTGRLWRALGRPGTPAGACAWRWLQEQGATVTCICGLAMADMDVERLSTLLTCLPALVSIDGLDAYSGLTLRPHPLAALAAAQDSLAGAARAIGRCSGLRRLDLRIVLHDKLADRVSATLWQYLAEARALEHLKLEIRSSSVGANASHLITGLAGLSRLRTLALGLTLVCEKATLPACLSRLVQLTSLSLSGLRGLRCTPGWARLPALVCLEFNYCKFDPDGEEALPGLDALGSLTSLELRNCTGLHMLPISLWRLTQLRCLAHCLWDEPPRGELPVARPSACAPACMASLTHLSLTGYNLPTWPVCILAATRLAHLDLSSSCFEHLPEGVSVLTGLETLYLGRHSKGDMQIGGVLDARTLGNLACFPALRELSFAKCSALFGPSFQAAAAHPRLERLELNTSYPGCALSCQAFLRFAIALLQQGRSDVLRSWTRAVKGVGQQDAQRFRGALQAVGFAHENDCDCEPLELE